MAYKSKGAQVAILPSYSPLTISAGYRNPAYLKTIGYGHTGDDFYCDKSFDVIAIGDGVIKMAGMEPRVPGKDGLWGVVGLVLDKFYRPLSGNVLGGVAQYMHMPIIYVNVGQRVKQGDVIGRVLCYADDPTNKYPGGHHLHLECRWDTTTPNRSSQVKGGRYIKNGADCTVNPNTWLHIAPGQSVSIHPNTTMATQKDLIARRVG